MTSDPWAAAATQTAGQNGNGGTDSQVIPEQPAQSQGLGGGVLFNGGGRSIPSLFNKSHQMGTVRTGTITDIKDVHSRELIRDDKTGALTTGGLKYWEDGNSGKGVKPVTWPVSKVTGKQNRPVMDTHIQLSTEYRMDESECRVIQRDPAFVKEDNGDRAYVVNDIKGFQAAIAEYNKENPGSPITKAEDLLQRTLTVKRNNVPGERRVELVKIS